MSYLLKMKLSSLAGLQHSIPTLALRNSTAKSVINLTE